MTIARRRAKERTFRVVGLVALALVLSPILGVVVLAGGASTATWATVSRGLLVPVVGTLEMAIIAIALAWPMGALVGIHLSEANESLPIRLVRGSVHALSGTPSLVVGMCVHSALVLPTGNHSALAGALALAIVMFPTFARTTEELLRLVPTSVREASLALGIPRYRAILLVSFATIRRGLAGALSLALGRALGDAAPLLVTAGTGAHLRGPTSGPTPSLPVAIFEAANASDPQARARASILSLVLIALVVVVALVGRRFTSPKEASA